MWALVIFMLLPTGQALAAKTVPVYATEDACKQAAPDAVYELANAIVEATQIPLTGMKPLVACSKTELNQAQNDTDRQWGDIGRQLDELGDALKNWK